MADGDGQRASSRVAIAAMRALATRLACRGLPAEQAAAARGVVLELIFLLGMARRGAVPAFPDSDRDSGVIRWLEAARDRLPSDTPWLTHLDAGGMPRGLSDWLSRLSRTPLPSLNELFDQVREQSFGLGDGNPAGRDRRVKGRYFTPPSLAAFIVDQALPAEADADRLLEMRVLDPAVGGGVFLREAARQLGDRLARAARMPVAEARAAVIERCLYGVDIDLEAVQVARWELLLFGATPGRMPVLGDHLRRGDALVGAEPWGMPWPIDPGDPAAVRLADAFTAWRLHPELEMPPPAGTAEGWLAALDRAGLWPVIERLGAAQGWLHWAMQCAPVRAGGFHAVIGNPPYLSEVRGGSALFARLKASPRAGRDYTSKGDLFYHFLALGIDLLRPGGRLAMLVPPYWRVRSAAARVREKVAAACDVRARVEFGEARLFETAPGHHSEILVLEHGRTGRPGLRYRMLDRDASPEEVAALLSGGRPVEGRLEVSGLDEAPPGAPPLTSGRAPAGVPGPVAVIEVGEGQVDLERLPTFRLSSAEVSQGVVMPQATLSRDGLRRLPPGQARVGDGIFWLRSSELEALELNPAERALVGPYLPVGSVWPYFAGPPEGWLLYLDLEAARALAAAPAAYPSLVAHLTRFAPAITSSRGPFGLHRPRHRRWFEGEGRLVVVRKTLRVKAARMEALRFVDQGMNVVRPSDPDLCPYLLGILGSATAERWFRRRKAMGALLQIDKDVLCALPLRRVAPDGEARRAFRRMLEADRGCDASTVSSHDPGLWQVVMAGIEAAAVRPEMTRAAIEAVVEALEARAAALHTTATAAFGARRARPGRGGRIHPSSLPSDPRMAALQAGLDGLVEALYGLGGGRSGAGLRRGV